MSFLGVFAECGAESAAVLAIASRVPPQRIAGFGAGAIPLVLAALTVTTTHDAEAVVYMPPSSPELDAALLGRLAARGGKIAEAPSSLPFPPGSVDLLVVAVDAPPGVALEGLAAAGAIVLFEGGGTLSGGAPGGAVGLPIPSTAWSLAEVATAGTTPVFGEAAWRETLDLADLVVEIAATSSSSDDLFQAAVEALVRRDTRRAEDAELQQAAANAAQQTAVEAVGVLEVVLTSRSWRMTAPLRGFRARLSKAKTSGGAPRHDEDLVYQAWVARFDTFTPAMLDRLTRVAQSVDGPTISVALPVYDPPEGFLRRTLDSVLNQIYPRWELCIADDASTKPYVRAVLEEYARRDSRIRVVFRERNGHISAATNTALEAAASSFVAFLDHDDELAPHALYCVAEALVAHPATRLLYTDEDRITERGIRYGPHFKPDFNPELLLGQNYITHLSVIDRGLVEAVGGLRAGYEGSQDHDLVLRCTAELDRREIHHVPRVLYHWRAIEGSVALSLDEKPYAVEAGRRAVEAHVRRRAPDAVVEHGVRGATYRVRLPLPHPAPLVSIVIPTRNGEALLRRCIGSILSRSTYERYEILVVDNQSDAPGAVSYLEELTRHPRIRVMSYDAPFNYAAINNQAARAASGEFLILLNNDTEVVTPEWIEEMLMWGADGSVGTVGAKLLYSDDTIQHAGIIMGIGGIAGHSHRHFAVSHPGYFSRLSLVHQVGGNTAACMLIRRDVYLDLGGLNDVNLGVSYNDVDLCLRLTDAGFRHVFTPFAVLYHHESVSRGSDQDPRNRERAFRERQYMEWRWGARLLEDPSYNPNLSLASEDFRLAKPPRIGPLLGVTDPERPNEGLPLGDLGRARKAITHE